jgi:hypothetical protein
MKIIDKNEILIKINHDEVFAILKLLGNMSAKKILEITDYETEIILYEIYKELKTFEP